MFRLVALSLLLFGASLLASLSPASAADPPTETILVGDFYFCAPEYEGDVCNTFIDPGDTILWDFSPTSQLVFHTVTDCGADCNNPTGTPLFNSGALTQGGSYKFTFNDPGAYIYYCVLHPVTMRGTIFVGIEPTATFTPTTTPPPAVGGISLDPAMTAADADRSGTTLPLAAAAAVAGSLLLLGGGLYAARRISR